VASAGFIVAVRELIDSILEQVAVDGQSDVNYRIELRLFVLEGLTNHVRYGNKGLRRPK
jgi:anti-sigma regulatory factor (Ser/Thr protein kinase)